MKFRRLNGRLRGCGESTRNLWSNVEHLTKRYRSIVALDDVSLAITDGITGLLGENGAGKSTLIKILLGLVRPTSGSALVLGESAFANTGVRGRIGYMPEHDCLPSQVSAAEFLTHMAEVSGLPPSAARTRAADTLRLEVGSPEVDGRVYKPHKALVRVRIGELPGRFATREPTPDNVNVVRHNALIQVPTTGGPSNEGACSRRAEASRKGHASKPRRP